MYSSQLTHLIIYFILGIRPVISNKANRDHFVALRTAGVTIKKIVKHLNVCRKKVYSVGKQFQVSGTTSGKPIPCRARTVRDKTIFFFATEKNMHRKAEMEWNRQKTGKTC